MTVAPAHWRRLTYRVAALAAVAVAGVLVASPADRQALLTIRAGRPGEAEKDEKDG